MKGVEETMAKINEARRYRLSIPEQDASVQEWLASQINISVSIRALIREDIQKNGLTDVTCRDVELKPKVGRPTTQEVKRRELEVEQDTVYIQPVQIEQPVPVQTYTQAPIQIEQPPQVQVQQVQQPVQQTPTYVQPQQPVQHIPVQPTIQPQPQQVQPVPSFDNDSVLESLLR